MNFIELINYLIQNILSIDFGLISLTEIKNRVIEITDWQKLLFDFEIISSLVVYFGLFYFIYYVMMYLPFKTLKRLFGQK